MNDQIFAECINWPNYIKLEDYKEEQEVEFPEQKLDDLLWLNMMTKK